MKNILSTHKCVLPCGCIGPSINNDGTINPGEINPDCSFIKRVNKKEENNMPIGSGETIEVDNYCGGRQPDLLAAILKVRCSVNRINIDLKEILNHMEIINPPTCENPQAFNNHLIAKRYCLLSEIESVSMDNEAMLSCLFSHLKEI
jgi:hypothetical protein